jgi:ferredoxin
MYIRPYQNSSKNSLYYYNAFCYNCTIKDISFHRRKINMAYKITDACIACGACAAECPVEAISEGENIYVIDADACIDCGSCADACPVDAPVEG